MTGQPLRFRFRAVLLALLVIGGTFVPPLLDAAVGSRVAHVEQEHDPATCAVLHDHAACSQLARSFALLVAGSAPIRSLPIVTDRRSGTRVLAWTLRTFSSAPSPRGPPSSDS